MFTDDGGIGHRGEDSIARDLRAFLDRSPALELKFKPKEYLSDFSSWSYWNTVCLLMGLLC